MDSTPDSKMQMWASRTHLKQGTLKVLIEQGFTSMSMLEELSEDDITEFFQKPKVLPLAQCIALRKAIQQIDVEDESNPITTDAFAVQASQPRFSTSSCPGSSGNPTVQNPQLSSTSKYYPCHKKSQELRFLLVGKTGSGKSTTGNSVLGERKFHVGLDFESVTYDCELMRGHNLGRDIEIMDSPGLFDTKRNHDEISIDIIKSVIGMHPGPHAILYVIPLGRYTDEEYGVYTRLKALFDDHLTRYLIILFTGGDKLEECGEKIENMLEKVPAGLRKVLEECGHHYVVFNNKAADKRPHVEQLFQLVDRMIRSNRGQPYTCPKYDTVGQGLEAEVQRRMAEVEQRDVERTKYVQQLQEDTKAAQQAVDKERADFQQREEERKQEMEREQEIRDKEIRDLQKTMKKQNVSLQKQRHEERKLREKMEKEKNQYQKALEEQRKQEQAKLEQMEKEMKEKEAKQKEEEQKREKKRDKMYEKMMQQVKDSATESRGSLGKFAGALAGRAVEGVVSAGEAVIKAPGKFFTWLTSL